jgi:hypothetical protein
MVKHRAALTPLVHSIRASLFCKPIFVISQVMKTPGSHNPGGQYTQRRLQRRVGPRTLDKILILS